MDRPEIILAPGPTPIPPEVLLAQGSPLVYHRGPGFGALMREGGLPPSVCGSGVPGRGESSQEISSRVSCVRPRWS